MFKLILILIYSSYSHLMPCLADGHLGGGMEYQLYEDLLYNYNRIPIPVKNSSEILVVEAGAWLIRIIDVDEKNQIFTTNLWLEMEWSDINLKWDPTKYGNIKALHIPSDLIWIPDLVLYNNAAGDPDITIMADALVTHNGRVHWRPPAIYKSFCSIDVTWFPYDLQSCEMKFGTWSYNGYKVDLKQLPKESAINGTDKYGKNAEVMQVGMDISFYHQSAEWDLISLSSARHSVFYPSCCGPEKYVDITYYFVLRRKTLFFTCNLIVPCFLISLLTTTVFYLCDHKITFSISILLALTVFFLVLIDIIPPTSLVIPMFGRYLITTMVLVSLSTIVSVISLNIRFRSGPQLHMPRWIRNVFLEFLPKVLFLHRPQRKMQSFDSRVNHLVDPTALVNRQQTTHAFPNSGNIRKPSPYIYRNDAFPTVKAVAETFLNCSCEQRFSQQDRKLLKTYKETRISPARYTRTGNLNAVNCDAIVNILSHIRFITEHFDDHNREKEVSDEWRFVAIVFDRLFLIIFTILNVGALLIILEAPSLRDKSQPMNITLAEKPLGLGLHNNYLQ